MKAGAKGVKSRGFCDWTERVQIKLLCVLGAASVGVLAGCSTTGDVVEQYRSRTAQFIVVSIADQKLALIVNGRRQNTYPISSSRSGVGETENSDLTPRGLHEIAEKIGDGVPIGMVFEDRLPTGEVVEVNAPNRWPVVTRILRLGGLEEKNRNTFERFIYIHGSPVERLLGTPASGGCIRMRSSDVIELFERVKVGTVVEIRTGPIGSEWEH